ncbi:MAG: enoyl-[acyl-carrier-protein] reductase FabK [Dehalococcoidia bacterium]
MLSTRFTELVGCRVPIQSAPMGSVSTPDLAAAVVSAGGHAMLAVPPAPAPIVAGLLDAIHERGLTCYGFNILVPFLDRDVLELVASRAPLVDFYLGPPDRELVDIVHAKGALAGWQVTSTEEAVAAREAGCDLVVAHGVEAGGRNPGGMVGLLPLLAEVLDAVDIPVLAAGGIATARGVAAVLAAGADGARLGTRFVASAESGAHPEYVEALLGARAEDTTYTERFAGLLPPELPGSRVLRSAIDAAEAAAEDVVGEMALGPERMPIPRFAAPPPVRTTTGNIRAMALYAGESAGAVRAVQPAAEIVAELAEGAEHLLRRWD